MHEVLQTEIASRLAAVPESGVRAPALIQVASLTKRYGDQRALTDISFAVHAGEVLGLIGPNGAGKTTLMQAIAGVVPADAGHVLWRGAPLPLPPPARAPFLSAGRSSPLGRPIRRRG